MIKSKNKWDNVSQTEKTIVKIVKIVGTIVFLAIWTPTMVYVTGEVIKLISK
jgi:hypothetical protein